jgi:selenocysteine lyase/cysteine desulfurase
VDRGLYRDLFPGTDVAVYLDTAAVGLISTRVADAMSDFATGHLVRGIADGARREEEKAATRRAVAELVGGAAERVAFTQNTSTGLALVANGIDWAPGDSVVVPAGEFPSNFYPWTQLRRYGVELREVAMREGFAPPELVAEAVDDSTRVLAVSSVQYSSGHRNDLAALAEIARAHRALLVIDGTQSVGALVLDADALGVDVLAVSAHKWMLGPLGIGFAHLSERAMAELHPSTVGWLSAAEPFAFDHEPRLAEDGRRFESGTENMAGIAGLRQAVAQVLELGREAVERQVIDRTEELAAMLTELGWRSLRGPDERRWSGLLFATSGGDDRAVHARLSAGGVRCSLRGGGIRFAPHYFTDSSDVAAVRALLT